MMNLQPLFKPKTMAVIGVSTTNERHPANVIYSKNHHRYPVETFAVNPRGGALKGDPIFPAISDIPEQIELAVIAARADYVPDILKNCIESGVKPLSLYRAGFPKWADGTFGIEWWQWPGRLRSLLSDRTAWEFMCPDMLTVSFFRLNEW